jgi:hypothetical protein
VFGDLNEVRKKTRVRAHGSRYESLVPVLIHGRKVDWSRYCYNLDLTRYLDLERS